MKTKSRTALVCAPMDGADFTFETAERDGRLVQLGLWRLSASDGWHRCIGADGQEVEHRSAIEAEHAAARHLIAALRRGPAKEPESRAEQAARAAGWRHGGDCGGFWFHGPTWGEDWKAAASWSGTDNEPNGPSDKTALYDTLAELCVAEHIEA